MTYSEKNPLSVIQARETWLGLTENWIYTQLQCLPPWVQCHVLCNRRENRDRFTWPSLYTFPTLPVWRFFLRYGLYPPRLSRRIAYLGWLARRTHARILHSHFGFEGWINLRAARKNKLKHVVTFYGVDVNHYPQQHPVWRRRYRELFAEVDLVLCEGPYMAECIRQLGCPPRKVRVHHLGIRVDQIACRPRTRQPDEPLRVLIAAAFTEKKGIPLALEALGRLNGTVPLRITLIGDAKDEPRSQKEKEKILETIEKYALHDRIRLLGFQPLDVFWEQAYQHHLFLSPSLTASDGDTEGGAPVSLIETSASGMPVISTTHCDIPGVILDNRTGLLSEESNVDGLVASLRQLANEPQRWPALGRAGRDHIQKEFDARRQGEKLAAIYEELLND